MGRLKIILVGPLKSGKSTIANFLTEAIEYSNDEYRPTPGVRIIEFEIPKTNSEVELWDCSGEQKYEPIWPVFLWNAHGVCIVFNPEEPQQLNEMDRFCDYFVAKSMISPANALLIANCKNPEGKPPTPDLSGAVTNMSYVSTNVLENGDGLREAFERFVSTILTDNKTMIKGDLGMLPLPI